MRKNSRIFILLAIGVVVVFVADLVIGSVKLPLSEILAVISGQSNDELIRTLLLSFRLPKAIVAVLAGAALSASGLQMQTMFRNPLAGPYVLGVSSGASLGVALFLLGLPLFSSVMTIPESVRNIGVIGSAWIGSSIILLIVMTAATRLRDIMAILILGMMIGSGATAIVEMLQYLTPEHSLKTFVVWTMGSLGSVTLNQLPFITIFTLIGLIISIILIKPLNLLLLGENYAKTSGINIFRVSVLICTSTILLAGTITAFCGPIGFVGIAIPHIARMLIHNADHRILMPASMLLGAIILPLCDIISQLPGMDLSLPINTITALMGIPIIIVIILHNRRFF